MARRALLVGINDYRGIRDLKGCINDVGNMRHILKTYLGFSNNDIRVVVDSRADKQGILYRLEYMVKVAQPGDFMVFHFSGHGSQIRDRNGDELEDHLDELLCPWDMDWEDGFILDDDLDRIFKNIPEGAFLEVFLDCCHSGTATRGGDLFCGEEIGFESEPTGRFLPPPPDIAFRFEGETGALGPTRGFQTLNRSGVRRSTASHILWSGCRADQTSADAYINGGYNGAFTYFFCKHMRETGGNITRRNLLTRVRDSLRYNGYLQTPQLECMDESAYENHPLQWVPPEEKRRYLYLTTPYMRGEDVRQVQSALAGAGYAMGIDGVFGPHTREVVKRYQRENGMTEDGIVGPSVYKSLLGD